MANDDIIKAHKHSWENRVEVLASELCGCFYCLRTFPPATIKEWWANNEGELLLAVCPYCGIDSVIGSESGYPITHEFLEEMQKHWFGIHQD